MGLQVSIRESGDVSILDLQGRATIGRGNDLLSGYLRNLVDRGVRKVLLNLEGVQQVDSSSISTIVRASVSLAREGGGLKLLRPRGTVLMVLQTLHLLDAISTFEDEAEALASFR